MYAVRDTCAAVLVAVTLLTGHVAPAAAESWATDDPAGDGAPEQWGDVVQVRANHSLRRVWVRVTYAHTQGDLLNVYLDTRARNEGPEFNVQVNGDWPDQSAVYRIDDFGRPYAPGRGAVERECTGLRSWLLDDEPTILVRVPRRCLRVGANDPARVRVSVLSANTLAVVDWAPGRREYSPWLRHPA
ncbi:MAG TPA: hypothetical protein VFK41_05935 [Nocardioidaceae bacterium]|nr:hypothetical protein [Nocardioidaceae bacterium]